MIAWFDNWHEVRRNEKKGAGVPPLRLRKGFTLYHRPEDIALIQIAEVLRGRCYRQYIDEPQSGTVIDIGANIGVASLDWGTRLPGVVVYAYEPHPQTYSVLAANVEANVLGRKVKTYQQAVGRCRGLLVLRGSAVSVNNTAYGGGFAADASEEFEAEMISFDDVIERCEKQGPPDLVKIDAEGAEADILEGASGSSLERVRQFVLEYHDSFVPGSLSRCQAVLTHAGFSCIIHPDPVRIGLGLLYAHNIRSKAKHVAKQPQ